MPDDKKDKTQTLTLSEKWEPKSLFVSSYDEFKREIMGKWVLTTKVDFSPQTQTGRLSAKALPPIRSGYKATFTVKSDKNFDPTKLGIFDPPKYEVNLKTEEMTYKLRRKNAPWGD